MLLESPKIITNKVELNSIVNDARSKKEIVVFTNGCFDIIHPGHVYILEQAKAKGDILIVGLNSDSSIKSFKSSDRPICNQDDRAYILAAFSCVDHIIIFDEDTPEKLISDISPDVLVKGKDYEGKEIAGSKYMLDNNKKIELVDIIDGKSTSSIISNIQKAN
jgi:D-beta-D-heptose 7-phosphate kinase/D-beta-D-heptose 1-phosphate adenosyltransferase